MESIQSDLAPKPIGPYSQAVRAGDYLFISGQVPLDPATGQVVAGDIQAQAHRVFQNLKAVLASANADFSRVVKTTVYLTDLKEFPAVNFVYAEFFSSPYPSRATVQVSALPANARIEIDAVAYLGY